MDDTNFLPPKVAQCKVRQSHGRANVRKKKTDFRVRNPLSVNFSAAMYIFEVNKSIFSSSVKISLSVLIKMAVLCQIKVRGRFC